VAEVCPDCGWLKMVRASGRVTEKEMMLWLDLLAAALDQQSRRARSDGPSRRSWRSGTRRDRLELEEGVRIFDEPLVV